MSLVAEIEPLPVAIDAIEPDRQDAGCRVPLRWQGVALFVVAALLRIVAIDRLPGLNGDEAWSGVQALHWLGGQEVAWHTPTGNPLNPFAILPLVASHALFAPSVAHLRWVAVASGLLAIAVNYRLCRRAYDRETAWTTSAVLAVLPVNLVYSRFAWDASQSLLFTLPVLYAPLIAARGRSAWRWWALGGVALAAAVLVHPTNVFAAPLLVVPLIVLAWQHRTELSRRLGGAPQFAAGALGLLLFVAFAWLGRRWWVLAGSRLISPHELAAFLRLYLDLFTGLTVFRFVPGTLLDAYAPGAIGLTVGGLLLALAAAWGWLQRRPCEHRDAQVLAAWAVTLVGFYLVAGAGALQPHYERYGQGLIGVGVLVLARGWQAAIHQATRVPARLAGMVLAWTALLVFVACYLVPLDRGWGHPHRAFRTGAVEPKQAALELACRAARRNESVRPLPIVAHDWWSFWPLAYLGADRNELQIVADGAFAPAEMRATSLAVAQNAGQFAWIDTAVPRVPGDREVLIFDKAGHPIAAVIFPPAQ
ncbi:MAG: glycosyltransferase family 39 protein [Pirellulales bacterium]|nr:glycosyltransferase family 39 protein [Pirellulales bacterium]